MLLVTLLLAMLAVGVDGENYEDTWDLPVVYQDCDRREPCCWRTYYWLWQQYNSLM